MDWIKANITPLIVGAAVGIGAILIVAHIPVVGAVVMFVLGVR